MDINQYLTIAGASVLIGYVIFKVLLIMLPKKLKSENVQQRQMILEEAQLKIEARVAKEENHTASHLQLASEELEEFIEDHKNDLVEFSKELDNRHTSFQLEENRVNKRTKDLELLKERAAKVKSQYDGALDLFAEHKVELQEKLEQAAQSNSVEIKERLKNDYIEHRQLDCTGYLKILTEEYKTNSARNASRALARIQARYTPDFVWPKSVNHVELTDKKTIDLLNDPENTLIADLTELSEGVSIILPEEESNSYNPVIRLGGGFGIYKEASKLSLEELVNKPTQNWSKVASVYDKHRRQLEAKALQMGKDALYELQVDGMHIEIVKLIGALNWRTSYRQNQFHHSVEVSKLAGILAYELGIDPQLAKRCGLLHDIGKAIDYRIEGSHAVISGDYADRYGESKIVCDTVMSHHADLVMETPLAYILMSADTLSGARPGARVNLEEGYQDRLSSIQDVIKSFSGVIKVEIMNGAREVHIEVNHQKVRENDLENLSTAIARKIETDVAYPGQIKVLVARRFEAVAVA